jgi:hypothetical protein
MTHEIPKREKMLFHRAEARSQCRRIWSTDSLTISIQPSFKSTIGFVESNVGPTNPMVDLKMRWVGNGFVSFLLKYNHKPFLDTNEHQRKVKDKILKRKSQVTAYVM